MSRPWYIVVKLRLQRYGAASRPFYRLVAADVNSPRDGRFIEQLGTYDAVNFKTQVEVKPERISYWLSKGAVPTKTVSDILKKQGILQTKQATEQKA